MRGRDERFIAVMLGAMRKFSKSWVAIGLIGLLIIAFLFFGLNDVFKGVPSNIVAKAGQQRLKTDQFKRDFDGMRKQAEQQNQRPISVDEAVAGGIDKQVLTELGMMLSINEVVSRLGIRIGDDLFAKELTKNTGFFDPITGKFDPKLYASRLAENGFTPDEYQTLVSQDLAQKHTLGALGIGYEASRTHAAVQAAYALQGRDARFLLVDGSKVASTPPPTDAQLAQLLNEVAEQARRPEFRQLTIVRFSAKALAPTIKVTPEAVQQVFNFNKDSLAVAERRTVVQVPAKSQAEAAKIAARLAKGEDPAAVAKAVGSSIVTYDAKPKTAIADRKVADAAFTLAAGQSSGPISGDLGFAAVKVLSILPGKTVTLEDVRPQMEQEARERAAETQIADQSDRFEAAHNGGSDIMQAAKAVGITPIITSPVTAQGQPLDGKPTAGLSQKLLKTAFELPQGATSELTEDERGEYYIVYVNKVTPPALPTINEIRLPLAQEYISRDTQRRVRALADQLAARIRKGETVEAVAASISARTGAVANLTRLSEQAEAARIGAPVVGAIFAAKPGEVVVAPGSGGVFVAKVETVRNGDTSAVAQMVNQMRQPVTRQLQQEFQLRIAQAARDAVKLKIYPDNAARAIGVEPASTKATKEKGAGG